MQGERTPQCSVFLCACFTCRFTLHQVALDATLILCPLEFASEAASVARVESSGVLTLVSPVRLARELEGLNVAFTIINYVPMRSQVVNSAF